MNCVLFVGLKVESICEKGNIVVFKKGWQKNFIEVGKFEYNFKVLQMMFFIEKNFLNVYYGYVILNEMLVE